MSVFTKTGQQIAAPVDESGNARPISPQDFQVWMTEVERFVSLFVSSGGLIYSSKAAMDADLSPSANTMVWVYGDPVAGNNGVWGKVGGAGTGSWTRRGDLPYSFIIASDAGAGTPNAIVATTALPVSESALVWLNIADTNSASPVTVAFNGGAALTVKTNGGNDVAAAGLAAGMIVMGVVSASTFRLVSDQASSAIVAAAEAAQVAAESAAQDAATAVASVNIYPTRALAEAADLSAKTTITVARWATGHPYALTLYNKVVSEPAHEAKLQGVDGSWWEINSYGANVLMLGAMGDGDANDTAAIALSTTVFGEALIPSGYTCLINAGEVDLRNVVGAGTIKLSSGPVMVADRLFDRGPLAQIVVMDTLNTGSSSVTQSHDVFDGKFYRSQQGPTGPGGSYDYDSIVKISEYDIPSPYLSRADIDYTTSIDAVTENYEVELKGLGHGDGISFFRDGSELTLYAHASAPAGSGSPSTDATGYVKFAWNSVATAQEPADATFYRGLKNVGVGNFKLAPDGTHLLFAQRETGTLVKTAGSGSVETITITVHDRDAIESALDPSTVDPIAYGVLQPHPRQDTRYADSGIASDGKYIYLIVCGARVVGQAWLYVFDLALRQLTQGIEVSGMRAENLTAYRQGIGTSRPIFHEIEGITFLEDKLLLASRYTFATGGDVVTWGVDGKNYVYISETPIAGKKPSDISYWAPTDAAATAGAYNNGKADYARGTVVHHHFIHAIITAGTYGSEEFPLTANVHRKPMVDHSLSGALGTRVDWSVCFDPLNSPLLQAMATFRTAGEFHVYNAEGMLSGDWGTGNGFKVVLQDKTETRLMNTAGVSSCGWIALTNSDHPTFSSQVLAYSGATLISRFGSFGQIIYTGAVRPSTSGGATVGAPSTPFANMYSVNALTVTSDIRLKKFYAAYVSDGQIGEVEADRIRKAEHSAALEIARGFDKFKRFTEIETNGEDGALWHYGPGAQWIAETLERHGLSVTDKNFLQHHQWDAEEEVWHEWPDEYELIQEIVEKSDGTVAIVPRNGNLITAGGRQLAQPAREAGDMYLVNVEELHSFIVKALIDHIDKSFSAVEARLTALES